MDELSPKGSRLIAIWRTKRRFRHVLRTATPITEIADLNVGAVRPHGATDRIEDLRAIPRVSGVAGAASCCRAGTASGTAVEQFIGRKEHGMATLKVRTATGRSSRRRCPTWRLLAKAIDHIASRYAALVADRVTERISASRAEMDLQ
jgi:phosphoenolpyruvate carboxylase